MIKKLLAVIICFTMVLSIGGVYATWQYASGNITPVDTQAGVAMGEFYYAPEEVMPDNEEVSQAGQNHIDLLQLILYESSKGYGLNINKKPIVHNYLKNPGDVVYCDQNTSGGNLKFMLDDNNTVNRLFFCIEKVSDVEYACYTFSYDELVTAPVDADYRIVVFKTKLEKIHGEWDDTQSAGGHAEVISRNVNCGRSIDIDTWVYGNLPKA